MNIHEENLKKSKKATKIIRKFGKIAGYKINTKVFFLSYFLYIINEKLGTEIKNTICNIT